MKKALARLALRLGGFDKVRKQTLPQVQLMFQEMAKEKKEEQRFLAQLHDRDLEEDKEPKEFMSFSDAFKVV